MDISYNECGTYGSAALATWFGTFQKMERDLGVQVSLKKLLFAGCSLDIHQVMKSLKSSLYIDTIHTLDLSYNKMDKMGLKAFLLFLDTTNTLSEVRLAGCSLSVAAATQILVSIGANPNLSGVTIDFSENSLGVNGATAIAQIIRSSKNIAGLNLKSNNIKREGMSQLLKACAENPTVKDLDVSLNKCGKNSAELCKSLGTALSESSLQYLNITGARLGKELGSAFKALDKNNKVQRLCEY
jgi:Ran GTPase-activating protein (RanGAP) involved in mRNA processing and transport